MERLHAPIRWAATLVVAATVVLAQPPLPPVQYVNPSSTLQDIQQALDAGGTVFFEYGEYYQIASSTPDDPPPTPAAAKGFTIGQYGKDVSVIGQLGPNGQRPTIYGGSIPFRVFGRVSFRLDNLEIHNPGMATSGLAYSRVGILVLDVLGSQG